VFPRLLNKTSKLCRPSGELIGRISPIASRKVTPNPQSRFRSRKHGHWSGQIWHSGNVLELQKIRNEQINKRITPPTTLLCANTNRDTAFLKLIVCCPTVLLQRPHAEEVRCGDTSTSTLLAHCYSPAFATVLAQASRGGCGTHTDLQAPTLLHATLARVVVHGTQHSQLFMPHRGFRAG
jgi:hypothetical protein